MSDLTHFLHALILVPVTMLPIINPLSCAPVFTMTARNNPATSRELARRAAINCWFLLVGSMLVGAYALGLLGISLPIVRVGGGLFVAASGWRMLNRSDDDDVTTAVKRAQRSDLTHDEIVKRSFFPITFPLTIGPGPIAAAVAIGAGLPRRPTLDVLGAFIALLGATLTVAVIYLVYRNATALIEWLGEVGVLVLTRLMAFVLLCTGIQIMWTGWAELNGIGAR